MRKQSFLHGTMVLVGAGFITKILGFVYRIALSRIIGPEGMGLFQMAFPILIFAIVVTTAGLPVAISKMVSEAEVRQEEHKIRSILVISLFIIVVTSLLFTCLILLGAPIIAHTLLTDARAIYSLLAIAPILPIIAVSSVFRGYFQGRQNMSPYALSTIVEQLVRIFTVLMLAQYLLPYGIAIASAGAMIGMVLGEFMGMLFLLYSFKKDPRRPELRTLFRRRTPEEKKFYHRFRSTLSELLRTAIPVTASRMIGSLSYAVEPIVVAQSLALAGIAVATATALYGKLEGMAIPLLFFPAFITYALSVSLVPAISEAAAQNKSLLVEHRLQQAIRLSLISGAPCVILMYVLAKPLSVLLYHQADVAHLMQVMAPSAIFLYLQGPLSSVLQGLDQAKVAMRNSFVGAIVKTGLIFLLASRPEMGIDGVAMAINFGVAIVTLLHFISISRLVPLTIYFRDIAKLIFATLIMGWTAQIWMEQNEMSLLGETVTTLLVSLAIYIVALLVLSLIRKDDVSRIPYVGRWMAHLLPR